MKYAPILLAAACLFAIADTGNAQRGASPFSDFHKQADLAIGKPAPAMHLQDTEGVERDLRDFLGRYVFIEFGSYT